MMYGVRSDLESQLMDDTTVGLSSSSVRQGFVRKVYGILAVQLIATGLVASHS